MEDKYSFLEKFIVDADEEGRDIMENIALNQKYKCDISVIGKTVLGREIKCYRVGNGKKNIFYVGTHHAKESICTNLLYSLIYTLLNDFSSFDEIRHISRDLLLMNFTFYIVPCLNCDGVEMRLKGVENSVLRDRQMRMSGGDFSSWQANARGVDLNHNYRQGFAEYKAIERERGIFEGATLYSGEYAESEPESFAVANFIRCCDLSAIISLHSAGEEIYAFPNTRKVKRIASLLEKLTGYTLSQTQGTAQYGGLCDYSGSCGIPSFTFEVGKEPTPIDINLLPDLYKRLILALVTFPTLL